MCRYCDAFDKAVEMAAESIKADIVENHESMISDDQLRSICLNMGVEFAGSIYSKMVEGAQGHVIVDEDEANKSSDDPNLLN